MDQNTNVWELSLSGEALNAFKYDFDNILQQTLTTMLDKGSEEAAISVKFSISLTEDLAPDFEGTADDRQITTPKLSHKIKSVLQIKDERSGYCGGDGYELVWDPRLCKYTLRKIKSAQVSIFDEPDGAQVVDVASDEIEVVQTDDYSYDKAESEA